MQTVSLAKDWPNSPMAKITAINEPNRAQVNRHVFITIYIGAAQSKFRKLSRPFISALL